MPRTVGVIGAGIMGAGIAQLAAVAGAGTLVHDVSPEVLERGLDGIRRRLEREVDRGRLQPAAAEAAAARLEAAVSLEELRGCEIVIEAAPERLELKQELLSRLAGVIDQQAVIATNTSSLSITAVAAGVPGPERVVGLHFFNPAPVMRLVEVVPGMLTGARAVEMAAALGEAMGKRVIHAADVAGFLVNRCNRPFSLESLKLLEEQVASVEQIDRILRGAGGFRMGPFELMDLVGIDTNHAVAESFQRQSYGEPRYRPSPLAARMVAAGRLGRKTGQGWYAYGEEAEARRAGGGTSAPAAPGGGMRSGMGVQVSVGEAADSLGGDTGPESVGGDTGPESLGGDTGPEPLGGDTGPQPLGGETRPLLVLGRLRAAEALRELARGGGWEVIDDLGAIEDGHDEDGGTPWLAVDMRDSPVAAAQPLPDGIPQLVHLHDSSLHLRRPTAAGFHLVPPLDGSQVVELAVTEVTMPEALRRAQALFGTLGLEGELVGDRPGLVLGGVVCQLVNEAAFLIGEGNGSREDVEDGMVLGLSHPRGPAAWSRELGLDHVSAVLDALHRESGDPRYRTAPLLRRCTALGQASL